MELLGLFLGTNGFGFPAFASLLGSRGGGVLCSSSPLGLPIVPLGRFSDKRAYD